MPGRNDSFERAFKLASYTMLVAGFLSLLAAEAIGWGPGALYLIAVAASWRFEARLSRLWQGLAFAVLLSLFLLDLFSFSGVVQASVHLIMMVSLIKVFSVKASRDYVLLYALAFTYLLIASTFTISVIFLVCLVGFIFLSILSFILLESRRAYVENQTATFSLRSYLQMALMITLLIVVVAAPIFVAIPRSALGFFQYAGHDQSQLSGFSNKVNLGDIGRIISNRNIFMRVRVDRSADQVPFDLKWRGVILDFYDGSSWANQSGLGRLISRGSVRGGFIVTTDRSPGEQLRQKLLVEPPTNVIFAADRLVQVSGGRSLGRRLSEDANGTVSFLRIQPKSAEYTVDSDLRSRSDKIRQRTPNPIPPEIAARYLQLPQMDPRVEGLARSRTSDKSDDLAKALELETFLRSAYSYSLENVSARSGDPLADFLFESKAGHCEYFSTALAVMLRTIGIPSRVVNGFRRGEYNEWADHFTVRQSDAHSWVEAYFPGAGWVEMDATPATTKPADFYLSRLISQWLDALDVFWTGIITFDRLTQVGLFVGLGSFLRDTVDGVGQFLETLDPFALGGWDRFLRQNRLAVGLLLGLILAAISLFWVSRRYRGRLRLWWFRTIGGKSARDLAPAFYVELLDILDRKGFSREPHETPSEFCERVRSSIDIEAPERITHLYYQIRFGGGELDSSDLLRIQTWLRDVRSQG